MKSSIIGILGFMLGFALGGLSAEGSAELEKLNLRLGNIESQILGKSEFNEHLTKAQPFGNLSLRELLVEVCREK
ncbi:hypothetical protein JWV37_03550 [Sulfurospirillum sp. T05]|uniref:Uncharacterized protein n=1 Tax=Sulfurospirillum tamanense TaxID=2813362 RepID=A0ABS2WQF3_9BACT|nr:hypothetical protein [Sulfurospirillum tamanensis]MBN2963847.1 hypothetical protein [Sulfurospirillum tamanensis]